jgi:hypothetical protein
MIRNFGEGHGEAQRAIEEAVRLLCRYGDLALHLYDDRRVSLIPPGGSVRLTEGWTRPNRHYNIYSRRPLGGFDARGDWTTRHRVLRTWAGDRRIDENLALVEITLIEGDVIVSVDAEHASHRRTAVYACSARRPGERDSEAVLRVLTGFDPSARARTLASLDRALRARTGPVRRIG